MLRVKNRPVCDTRIRTYGYAEDGRPYPTARSISRELIGGSTSEFALTPSETKHRPTSKYVPFVWRVDYRNEINPPEETLQIAHDNARRHLQGHLATSAMRKSRKL